MMDTYQMMSHAAKSGLVWLVLAPTVWAASLPPRTNHLGMIFVPIGRSGPSFSVYETRVRDFAVFAATQPQLDGTNWNHALYHGVTPVSAGPDYPVVNVSWYDATAFCHWLTTVERQQGGLATNEVYRLPTDAEWSRAAGQDEHETGATPRARNYAVTNWFVWGGQFPPPAGVGNFADEAARNYFTNWPHIAGYNDGFVTTAPVGSFIPTVDGIYDLAGNALEWCQDWYDDSHRQRVLRGGSWANCGPRSLLASCREHVAPHRFSVTTGFRCVLAVQPD